jgi:glycosidase
MRAILCGALLSIALAACDDAPNDHPPWEGFVPPDEHGDFGGYGSGSGPGDMAAGPPMCDDSARRCPQTFSYPSAGNETSVTLIGDFAADGWTTGVPMTKSGSTWSVSIPAPWNGKVTYKFHIVKTDTTEAYVPDPANPNQVDDGFGGKNSVLTVGTCAVWTCVSTAISCPGGAVGGYDWRDAVIYYVFTDRFNNGDATNDAPNSDSRVLPPANWQGGDWQGVIDKINAGYFQDLGVNTLWIAPPMDASESVGIGQDNVHYFTGYHGYWPRDLTKTESHFGNDALLKTLVDTAHAKGMKVLIDYVMNHVHEDSPTWMQHMDWFFPLMDFGKTCVCGSSGDQCDWNSPTHACWFTTYLPTFDFDQTVSRQFSVGNMIYWIQQFGADGFRLDATKQIPNSWITDARAALTSQIETVTNQHVYLVGEYFDNGNRDVIKAQVDPCKMLDGQFDFPLRQAILGNILERYGSMTDFAAYMDSNTGYYGAGLMSTFVGNQDVGRSIHFAEDTPVWSDTADSGGAQAWLSTPLAQPTSTNPYERLAVAFGIVMTNRGVPLIYYGDEIGMAGGGDPDNRRFMNWNTAGYNAGQQTLLGRLKKLGALRAAHTALRRGDRTTLHVDNDTWLYKMVDGADVVYVGVNRADNAATISGLPGGKALTDGIYGDTINGTSVSIPARGIRVMY